MTSLQRSHTLSPCEIANRKLPELPSEANGASRFSQFWANLKSKLSLGTGRRSDLRRSQSVVGDTAGRTRDRRKTELPHSLYNQLINNHETMVLPGLRQFPPPIEDDEALVPRSSTVPALADNVGHEYGDFEIYEGGSTREAPSTLASEQNPPINEYQDIDELLQPSLEIPVRVNIGRRAKQKQPKMAALASSINNLHHEGWYWGPLNREETEAKLQPLESGSFLVRDSNDAHHLYTLSFKQEELILHTRIEFVNGLFTFFLSEDKARETGKRSVEELIISSMTNGVNGEFGDSRRVRGRPFPNSIKIVLTHPVSRFNEVRSLQFLCKFVLRANMNRENVANLPLPMHVKSWVHERDYF
ncbi:cytokine-inducible SH2-containing protein-like [Watersipora subatra]|uniref:cytokine-inducible SH2-containing protein-like n=1 Tax=Watersipora subatra TaxID=2589382 RepID=UPI00355C5DE6